MPRLMDVDVFKKNLDKEFETATDAFDAVDFALEDTPTIDAVPVIRCKNCTHYNLQALACTHDNFNGTIGMDGFCSYAERKE